MNDDIDPESKNEINVNKQLREIGKSLRQRYQNDQQKWNKQNDSWCQVIIHLIRTQNFPKN